MPIRSITASPEELAGIGAAFNRAWSEISARDAASPSREASKKEWLAHIVLGLSVSVPQGNIAGAAVDQFVATVPTALPRS
ncbi:hypothetical protein DWF00_16660 [Bosea caraganae]|uniref:hypothetical protein n=1 Tax=Bosea caraganae TaxID=2763117 RepID=UPI000E0CB00B|nr:hypothetical protein [Bosea caraganae]RDJ24853.1 hypothetical protein DWF00_16660 [Bosea caraganae]